MQDDQFISTGDIATQFVGVGDLSTEQFVGVGDLSTEAPKFVPVETYTTFSAEYALMDGDIVLHFFTNDDINAMPDARQYWKTTFPNVLSKTASAYFNADYPKLKAAYSEELASWWLRAYGFDHILDEEAFVMRFLEQLDSDLDTKRVQ